MIFLRALAAVVVTLVGWLGCFSPAQAAQPDPGSLYGYGNLSALVITDGGGAPLAAHAELPAELASHRRSGATSEGAPAVATTHLCGYDRAGRDLHLSNGAARGETAPQTRSEDIAEAFSPQQLSVATNTGTRLRPGLTQPGVARTLENSLNPDAYIDDVVSHYGINLRGSGQSISVQFNPNLASAGRVRAASPNLIEVGPNAFASSEEMARTVAHELNHARSFLRGGAAPESSAYGAEGYLSEWMAGLR